MSGDAEVDEQLTRYRLTLLEMNGARVELGGSPRRWNKLVDQLQRLHLGLRQHARGRAGIADLINDEVPTVRLWAATHALFWDEARARAQLEIVAIGPGIDALGARYTLREYDAGRLDTTWAPTSTS